MSQMLDGRELEHAARDVQNVLWRSPAALHLRVNQAAQATELSQNAFITTSLLFSTIVFGSTTEKGPPENFLALIREMNEAAQGDGAVLGTAHNGDWEQVAPTLSLLVTSGIVAGLKTRRDLASDTTTAYTFHFTKPGVSMWRTLGRTLETFIQSNERSIAEAGMVPKTQPGPPLSPTSI